VASDVDREQTFLNAVLPEGAHVSEPAPHKPLDYHGELAKQQLVRSRFTAVRGGHVAGPPRFFFLYVCCHTQPSRRAARAGSVNSSSASCES
jgi:hypothetical protein